MEYEHKDDSGNVKRYEISYSQELQKKQLHALQLNNWLLIVLLVVLFLVSVLLFMVWRTNVITNILMPVVCGA